MNKQIIYYPNYVYLHEFEKTSFCFHRKILLKPVRNRVLGVRVNVKQTFVNEPKGLRLTDLQV